MTRVFPDPGPARIRLYPSGAMTALRCESFRSSLKCFSSPAGNECLSVIFRMRPSEKCRWMFLPCAGSIVSAFRGFLTGRTPREATGGLWLARGYEFPETPAGEWPAQTPCSEKERSGKPMVATRPRTKIEVVERKLVGTGLPDFLWRDH